MKIAVIGAGISGLYAAHELETDHQVTLYEANDRLGGHTDTHDVATDKGTVSIDTGFIVFNENNYPLFNDFIRTLGVSSRRTDMSFSVSDRGSALEYNATTIRGLFCDPRNLARPGFYRMLLDILRFYRKSPELLTSDSDDLTIGDYLDAEGYGRNFVNNHLVPMASALWSSPPDTVARFPARYFVAFMHNHCMLQVSNRPLWQTIEGGSSSYVRSFEARFRGQLRKGAMVTRVSKTSNGVLVRTNAEECTYDAAILACHSDQAMSMLDECQTEQRSILSDIRYQRNDISLHSDISVMPEYGNAWASWNVVKPKGAQEKYVVTYYMNLLQGIECPTPMLVSLNADHLIDENKILLRRQYDHPVYTPQSLKARRKLERINGRDDIYFAGAYLGWGFHEDGARSARKVVDDIKAKRVRHAA